MIFNNTQSVCFAFFGSSRMSVIVLDELKKFGIVPSFVVTTSDKPQGRRLILTPNLVKIWALENGINVFDFVRFDAVTIDTLAAQTKKKRVSVFIVASYGKILPAAVIDLPPCRTLNIHPSLLPKYRGASPLQQAMLDDVKKTGVTIIRLDEQMDHGPIVAQKPVTVNEWPAYEDFEEMMAREGARSLSEILPEWVAGSIAEKEQDHEAATYTKKFTKEDGLIDLVRLRSGSAAADQYAIFRRIQAFHEWPQAYFIIDRAGRKMRVKITAASFKDGKLTIDKVIPEGSKEMSVSDFARGYGVWL